MKVRHWLLVVLLVGSAGLAYGSVWWTSHADVDGDGVDEGIDYVIGENGELNIPYEYLPYAHFIAWNTARTCMGVDKVRQIVTLNGTLLLDTGEPTLYNWYDFYYVGTYYNTMNTYIQGTSVITVWEAQAAKLERVVDLTDDCGVNRFRLWVKDTGGWQYAGETGLIVVWNDGMPTVQQARNHVINRLAECGQAYGGSFAGLTCSEQLKLTVRYVFDDFVSRLDSNSVLGWDGYNYTGPDDPAIWGMLHLPTPCSLTCDYWSSPATEVTAAVWCSSAQAQVAAQVIIKPETINLKSHGVFTAFIWLPAGYTPAMVNCASLVCEGAPAQQVIFAPDHLVAKFRVQDLVGIGPGPEVPFTVTGNFHDGGSFSGTDTVRVILPSLTELVVSQNPCRPGSPVVITISNDASLPKVLSGTARVFDQTGRIVRTYPVTITENSCFTWDVRTDQGVSVPDGVYFIQIDAAGQRLRAKVVVAR